MGSSVVPPELKIAQGKPESCGGCSLATLGKGFVPMEWDANSYRGLMLVGEGAGEMEARDGKPFRPFAASGSLLADAMRETNIRRSEVAIANCLSCHTPKDWLIGAPWEHQSLGQCTSVHLADYIRQAKPRAILALGGVAFTQLTQRAKGKWGALEAARGYVVPGAGVATGIPVVGTWHPSFIRRGSAHLTPHLVRDLRKAWLVSQGKLVDGVHFSLNPSELKLRYQVSPTVAEAWAYYRALDPTLPISFDIETPYSTRSDEETRTSFTDRDIKLFQCTQRRGEGIALPYREEFIDVIRAIMATPNTKFGFNNWQFDDPVLENNDITINGEIDDAMVMFRFEYSDLPANLQTAAQWCGFTHPWKHKADDDLATYGVTDVDASLCVYQTMKGLLDREGRWESYRRYFRDVWPILRDMSRRGVPISEPHRLQLKELIRTEDIRNTEEIQSIVPPEVLTTKQTKGLKNPPILECECGERTRIDHLCSWGIEEGEEPYLRPYVELAEENGLVRREFVVGESEKCRCTKKLRAVCPDCVGSGVIPVGTVEMRWAAPKEFNPNSSHQVKKYMKYKRHPVPKHSKRTDAVTVEASDTTEVKELERLFAKTKDKIYPLLIEKRQLTKIDSTYADGWRPSKDGRLHTTFTFQTATWQTTSRAPNIQNGIKRGRTPFQTALADGFNSMIRADEGYKLLNFDFKSFHVLTTGLCARSRQYMRLARLDMHSFVASEFLRNGGQSTLKSADEMFVMADQDLSEYLSWFKKDEKRKYVRDKQSKPSILGIGFGLGVRKLFDMNREHFNSQAEVQTLRNTLERLFPEVFRWQKEIRRQAAEDKYLVSKFGAIRRFNDIERWSRKDQKMIPGDQAEQAVAFLPANHAFGHLRWTFLNIRAKGLDERFGLFNSIHDSAQTHTKDELVEECQVEMCREMSRPSEVLIDKDLAPDGLSVEVDYAVGESMKELK